MYFYRLNNNHQAGFTKQTNSHCTEWVQSTPSLNTCTNDTTERHQHESIGQIIRNCLSNFKG